MHTMHSSGEQCPNNNLIFFLFHQKFKNEDYRFYKSKKKVTCTPKLHTVHTKCA